MVDKIFEKSIKKQFEFDEDVASVFDDMLSRSIPFYKQMQELTIEFALNYLQKDDTVYDLGCSTASTLIELGKQSNFDLNLIGIDNSSAMLSRASKKCKAFGIDIKLRNEDLLDTSYDNAKLVISNYTLQFIRPLQREKLIKKIYDSLKEDGIFIFSEKVISSNKVLNKQCIDTYYDFKKNKVIVSMKLHKKEKH